MVYYDHRLQENEGKPCFKFTKREPLHWEYELIKQSDDEYFSDDQHTYTLLEERVDAIFLKKI